MLYVGIDLHKEKVYGIVVDENGRIIKKGKFSNERKEFHKFLQHVEEAIVAIESTGFTMPYMIFWRKMDIKQKWHIL